MAILEVKGLSKYFGGLAALSDLDLTIDEGEIDMNLQYLHRKLGDTFKRKYNRIFQEDM